MLRVAIETGVVLEPETVEGTSAWLTQALERVGQNGESRPALHEAWLIASGLVALKRPVPREPVARVVRDSSAGALFRYGTADPTWAATQTAIELMELVGIQPPAVTIEALRDELARHPIAVSDDLLTTTLPLWILSSRLPARERAQLVNAGRAFIAAVSDTLSSAPPTGPVLGVTHSVRQLASDWGAPAPQFNLEHWEQLRSPDGLLRLARERPEADPQTTYYALRMGVPSTDRLRQSVALTAGPQGWTSERLSPDPEATYYGLALSRAAGDRKREKELRDLTARWLEEVLAHDSSGNHDPKPVRRDYFIVALATQLGLPVPSSIGSERLFVATDDVQRWLWTLRLASLLERDTDMRRLAASAPDGPTRSMRDAYVTAIAALAREEPIPLATREYAESLRTKSGSYRLAASAPPDLFATCAAAIIRGTRNGIDVTDFASPAGTSRFPHGTPGNHVGADTIAIGEWLRGHLPGLTPNCF